MPEPCEPTILTDDARALPQPDNTVDLIVTSPPYFGLRSYTDGGEHYDTQLGAETTPADYVEALLDCTREMMRVLKPSGSLWINLGDKYGGAAWGNKNATGVSGLTGGVQVLDRTEAMATARALPGTKHKSLIGIPWRYAIRCIDELGLILRAEVIWSKPNGLPESVTDRVRRSHEQWFHFTLGPRYFAAVDEIREAHARTWTPGKAGGHTYEAMKEPGAKDANLANSSSNPLGKLPGSVWEIATQPLNAPTELGVDHYAAFPMEWPRRIIQGWSPREICTVCGEGRTPVGVSSSVNAGGARGRATEGHITAVQGQQDGRQGARLAKATTITRYACGCPDTTAPSTPGVVLDPFGGTGTTALVATMHGRHGISLDASTDYARIAHWRAGDPKERARAAGLDPDTIARLKPETPGQVSMFDLDGGDG